VPAAVARVRVAAVDAAAVDVECRDSRTLFFGMEITMRADRWNGGVRANEWAWLLLALIGILLIATEANAASIRQQSFASPEAAAESLVRAVKAHDRAAILGVLGDAADWITSGDAVADRAIGERFVSAYEAKHAIVRNGDTATLNLGNDAYTFAFPIVKSGERWRFDTEAGKEELLARRIGENELDAIKVLQAIVDAQLEYASEDRNGDGVLAYARKFASSSGKRDGLYWHTKAGEPPSPLGALVARAAGEGYQKKRRVPTPYHGARLCRPRSRHRRLRRRRISGQVRQFRNHDFHRQSGREDLPVGSRAPDRSARERNAAIRSRNGLVARHGPMKTTTDRSLKRWHETRRRRNRRSRQKQRRGATARLTRAG
jgi:hypothetical protein